jgi:transcription termination factor Rho
MPYKRKTATTPGTPAIDPTVDDIVGQAPAAPAEAPVAEPVQAAPEVAAAAPAPVQRAEPAPYQDNQNRGPVRPSHNDYGSQQQYSQQQYPPRHGGGGYDRGDRGNDRGGDRGGNRYASTPMDTPTEEVKGYLDVQPEGHGFLRPKFIPSNRDIYISQSQIRRFMLRPGDLVEGVARPPKDTERYYGLLKVEKVNGITAEESLKRPWFDDLTAVYPKTQVKLATGKTPLSTRVIDLVAPIGFGQRGMIVSPPKAGKTTILKQMAAGITANFPEVHLMAALIGERPEEVTDIAMSVRGEVVASNFDEPPESQTRIAEIALERAKRVVESGKDVVILLDSITRLARAYNLSVESSGRTLSGGFDPAALWPAKKFFGAARNTQEGGSLTIIGTALVDTGSRMDDLIYEEFKGTGNMELHLDRKLADRRIFPAIDINRSGTRQEEIILSEEVYKKVVIMRRMVDMLGSDERTQLFVEKLAETDSNEAFLENMGKA